MAIGSVIGAVAGIGGALLGGSSQKKATKAAAAASDRAAEMEAQTARENMQLSRDVYNSNLNVLGPYNQLGYAGASARNALLGLGAGPAYTAPAPLGAPTSGGANVLGDTGGVANFGPFGSYPTSGGSGVTPISQGSQADYVSYLLAQTGPKRTKKYNQFLSQSPGATDDQKLAFLRADAHKDEISLLGNYMQQYPLTMPAPATPTTPTTPATPTTTTQDYENAFKQYLDSTGYQFQLGEGMKGLNFANRLTGVDSGAALKAGADYNRNMGQSYFGDYMGLLGQQQGMGLSAAGAVAGQGNIAAGAINSANSTAGNALAGGAINRGNAALISGNASANMWGGIGNSLGNLFGGSSFGGGNGVVNYGNSVINSMGRIPIPGMYGTYSTPPIGGW